MEPDRDRYRVTVTPAPDGPRTVRLSARFDNAMIEANATDQSLKVGEREVTPTVVWSIHPGSPWRVELRNGQTLTGPASGLEGSHYHWARVGCGQVREATVLRASSGIPNALARRDVRSCQTSCRNG